MNIQRTPTSGRPTPVMGNFFAALATAAQDFFSAKGGNTTIVPGAPAPLSMGIVGALGAAVVLMAVLKKKRVI